MIQPDGTWRSGSGKVLRPGEMVRVTGAHGRFKIVSFSEEPSGDAAYVYGGFHGRMNFRTFLVDRITTDKKATAREVERVELNPPAPKPKRRRRVR